MPDQQHDVKAVLDAIESPMDKAKRLLAKVRLTREHALYNRGRIRNGEPGKHYVWVNINEHRQIDYQSMGYNLVKGGEAKTQWQKPDGTHQRGDLVLYSIDKDMHEAIKMDDQLRAFESIDAPKHAFASTVEKVGGGRAYDPTPR